MRAVVLDGPGPAEALVIRERAIPVPRPGQVLIRVRAFGLNRSELHTRLGLAEGVTFPRVPGIEAVGEVADSPGGEFRAGQKVVTLMGGMGRVFDGGYAEYTCVPARQVIPFESELPWSVIGAIPEMLQTAHGSLTIGLDIQPGQSLLIRGGTSSVGMAAAILAKRRGLTVLASTRDEAKREALASIGVDHVLIDDGDLAVVARRIVPGGVDAALELVGTPTLRDTLRHPSPRRRLLHRHALKPVDGYRFLSHRLHSAGCPAHLLHGRSRRPSWQRAPGIPAGSQRRHRNCSHRQGLYPR
ncbi:NADPH:quinone reductase [Arthrobacter sp. ok362]|nr:NADPH:quinone reductase [Arthrobacter sp. ok362]